MLEQHLITPSEAYRYTYPLPAINQAINEWLGLLKDWTKAPTDRYFHALWQENHGPRTAKETADDIGHITRYTSTHSQIVETWAQNLVDTCDLLHIDNHTQRRQNLRTDLATLIHTVGKAPYGENQFVLPLYVPLSNERPPEPGLLSDHAKWAMTVAFGIRDHGGLYQAEIAIQRPLPLKKDINQLPMHLTDGAEIFVHGTSIPEVTLMQVRRTLTHANGVPIDPLEPNWFLRLSPVAALAAIREVSLGTIFEEIKHSIPSEPITKDQGISRWANDGPVLSPEDFMPADPTLT